VESGAVLQKIAAALLALDTTALGRAVVAEELVEICREEKSPAR
jgi:argininosuccinate synthase